MDFTVTLSEKFNVLPFEVLNKDKDEVIMLINYYIQKDDSDSKPAQIPSKKNDGFWDF